MPGRDALHQSADWLLEAGACEQAVVLYLDIGDHDCAARAITSQASVLMDLGQWATVDRWLARLPEEMFAVYPDLNCSRADIAAARGDTTTARRWFDSAASQYAKRNDLEGECRSMLAGSAVAAEAGDLANALSRAHAASSLREHGRPERHPDVGHLAARPYLAGRRRQRRLPSRPSAAPPSPPRPTTRRDPPGKGDR